MLSGMNDAILKFQLEPEEINAKRRLGFAAMLLLLIVITWDDGPNLAGVAIVLGSLLSVGAWWLRLKLNVATRLAIEFGPLMALLLVALIFDDQSGARFLWAASLLFFSGIVLCSIGDYMLTPSALIVRSFVVMRRIFPLQGIQSVSLRHARRGAARFEVRLKEPRRGLLAPIKTLQLQIPESEADEFRDAMTVRMNALNARQLI
jgi:hypothetical protein